MAKKRKTLEDLASKPKDQVRTESVGKEDKPDRFSPAKDTLSQAILEAPEEAAVFSSEGVLTPEEREFYLRRRREYLEEFNLNKSSDLGLIHRIIMEEIITERLYAVMIEHPERDYSKQMTESADRYRRSLEALGASRDKRLKNRESNTVSIADVAREYYIGGLKEVWDGQAPVKKAEEEYLLQIKNRALELEYGTLDFGEEEPNVEE